MSAWPRRLRLFSVGALLVELSAVSWLLFLPYLLTAHGHLDFARHAIGRDFINLWTAGRLIFTPHLNDIFHPVLFLRWERALFDPRLAFHFWSYPPTALFLAVPLAPLPYIPALILWWAAGLAALVPAAVLTFDRQAQRMLLIAAPAVAVNIALGQNGALTASLLLCGLALFERRPRLAGALLGLLVFKPQLAVLLPVAVISARRWDVMLAAAASAGLVILLSLLAFGPEPWRGFFGPTLETQAKMLSSGRGPFQWMMASVFMAGRVLGASAPAAMALQIPFTLLGAVMAFFAYRRPWSAQEKGALLILATFLATPQSFNYDLVAAAAAALILVDRDRTLAGAMGGALLWALPVLLLATQVAHAPIGPPVILFAAFRLQRSLWVCEAAGRSSRAPRAASAAEAASNT